MIYELFCNFAFDKDKTILNTNEKHSYYRLYRTDWF